MFGLFKSSDPKVKTTDKIWMSKGEKLEACAKMLAATDQCLFLCWFEATAAEVANALNRPDKVALAQKVEAAALQGKMTVFVEHYPLAEVEQKHFERLRLTEVPVLLSLDEPFFELFGGERIIKIMKRLGIENGEIVDHDFISKSIHRAQEKIAKKVRAEKNADSQKEWFEKNWK